MKFSGYQSINQKDVDSLERVQRKATRWVTSTYDRKSSVSRLMRELQLETSQERRRIQHLTFMYKILNGQVAVPAELIDLELSVRTGRGDYNQQKLYEPGTHTTEYQKSFVHRTIPEWNSLPSSAAQSDTVSTFKCRLSALP